MKAPCYKCEERHRGCHSECEQYQAWQIERGKERMRQRKQKSDQTLSLQYRYEHMERLGQKNKFPK